MEEKENKMHVSNQTEELIISGLLKNSFVFSLVKDLLKESDFTNPNYRNIYRGLSSYYKKYKVSPNLEELRESIADNFIQVSVDSTLEGAISTLEYLQTKSEINENFLIDKTLELVRKRRVTKTLNDLLGKLAEGQSYDPEDLAKKLSKQLNLTVQSSPLINLSDTNEVEKAKEAAIGEGKLSGVIKSSLSGINESLQYKGYQRGTLNLIVAPPGVGKSSFLVCEGSAAARAGNTVLHVFLGDMIQYDGFVRYLANISGIEQSSITLMNNKEQANLIKKVNDENKNILSRISILAYGSSEIGVDALLENIDKEQNRLNTHFDDIIIDYADNFKKDETKMYSEGGYIYDNLALYSRRNSSVIMVASQPKIQYWKDEIIPLEGAAESSKKQHIVDLLVTFNLVSRQANLGTMFIPKVRRGISGNLIRVETRWEKCQLIQLTESEYVAKKSVLGV